MPKLPFEIWCRIASYADRGDLLQLTLVSKETIDSSRRMLAREVTLHGNQKDTLQSILDYLVRTRLSYCIKKLAFRGIDMRMQVPDIPFASMPSLFSLAVAYRTPVPIPPQRRSRDKPSPQNFLLFRGTFANITELDISITTRCRDFVAYTELSHIRFPSLIILKIGPGHKDIRDTDYNSDEAIAEVSAFLRAHPIIVSLVLGHTAYHQKREQQYDVYIPVDPDFISKKFLPNLRSLDAHPEHIHGLARTAAPCLQTLDTLLISEKRYQNLDEALARMWVALKRYNKSRKHGPCAVQHFHLKLRKIRRCTKREPLFFTRPMASMVQIFPNLHSWSGDLPALDKTLFRIFPQFPQFRWLRQLTFRMGYGPLSRHRVRELANRCPRLGKVTCRISGICFNISKEAYDGVANIYTDQGFDAESEEGGTEPVYVSSDDERESQYDDEATSSGSDDSDAPCRHDCEDCDKNRLNMSSDDEEEENPEYPDDATTDEDSVWSWPEEEVSDDQDVQESEE